MNNIYITDLGHQKYSSARWVLIIDDDPLWQLIVERSLKRIDPNISVLAVSSAEEALEKFDDDIPFELVIADQALNGFRTGLDLWDMLWEQRKVFPFILISGTKKEDFQKSLLPYRRNEIPFYIEKTTIIKDLTAKIKRLTLL